MTNWACLPALVGTGWNSQRASRMNLIQIGSVSVRKEKAPFQELDWESTKWVRLRSLFLDESTRERIIACLTQCDQEVPLTSVPILRPLLMNQEVMLGVPLQQKSGVTRREEGRRRRQPPLRRG